MCLISSLHFGCLDGSVGERGRRTHGNKAMLVTEKIRFSCGKAPVDGLFSSEDIIKYLQLNVTNGCSGILGLQNALLSQ
jgi:hypothetical protein